MTATSHESNLCEQVAGRAKFGGTETDRPEQEIVPYPALREISYILAGFRSLGSAEMKRKVSCYANIERMATMNPSHDRVLSDKYPRS